MAIRASKKTRTEVARVTPVAVGATASAVDHVMAAIKSGIRDGRYVPGQRLVEPDMTRDFRVSRGSVREALRRLAAEGFVHIELYRGASIRKMSRNEVVELNQVRELLEGLAASLAAQHIDKAERKRLLELEQHWDRGTKDFTYAEYNEQFHALIVAASRHKQLPVFLQQAQLSIFRLQFHRILQTPVATRRSRLEHRRIVNAILKGEAKAAESAMRQHVRNSAVVIMAAPDDFFSV